jgi:hypothetical protein
MDPVVVAQILKGDTRASVVKKVGEASFEDAPKDGICHVIYQFADNKPDAISYVPYLNAFAGGSKGRSQTLSITYKNNIVQELDFTDNTMTRSGGLLSPTFKQKPTPGVNIPPTSQPQ